MTQEQFGELEWTEPEKASSQVAGWAAKDGHLFIQFHSGAIYRYTNVGPEAVAGLGKAESVGRYLNASIKQAGYEYHRVVVSDPDETQEEKVEAALDTAAHLLNTTGRSKS